MRDRDEIAALVHRYAELIDAGDMDGVVAMFAAATWRSDASGTVLRTPEEIREVYDRIVLYEDGTPKTRHLMNNLIIEMEDGADDATARCSYTVLQGGEPGTPIETDPRRALPRPLPPRAGRLASRRPPLHHRPRRRPVAALPFERRPFERRPCGGRPATRPVKFGFAIPAYGAGAEGTAVADVIVAGEELGYDSVWLPDHVAVPDYAAAANLSPPFLEPLATCAWGLGATTRLRFGTDVLVAPYRHPLVVAAMAGTLGRLAGDRLILGVGIGYLRGEFEVLGADYDARATDTEDWVRRVRTPPAGYSVVDAPVPVPIWIGGNNPKAHRRAALLGDGWHPLWLPAEDYAAAHAEILALRRDAGLTTPFTFSFSAGFTQFADRPAGGWPPPRERAPEGSEFRYAPAAWTAPDGRPRLVGSPDDLIGDLRLLADAGVDQVTLRFGTTDPAPLERFARDVMPAFA